MKKILTLLLCIVFGISGQAVFASTTSSSMQQYIRTYCSRSNPVQNCWRYDNAIDDAERRASILNRMFQRYDSVKRNMIVQYMLEEFEDIFRTSRSVEDKLVAAYYYDYFVGSHTVTHVDVRTYVADLFSDRRVQYDYDYDYEYQNTSTNATITSVQWWNSRTDISRSTIELRDDVLDLVIRAKDYDGREIRWTDSYRVVAKIDQWRDRTYAASYEWSGYWRLRLANTFDSRDRVTLYLLCKTCRSGSVFRSDSILDGWRIADTKNYSVSTSSRYSSDRYTSNSYYDDDYDLELQRLRYTYDLNRNDAEVRLTTTVRNVWDRDVILDELEYEIEVDWRRLSSRNYTIDHIRTDCDDSYVNSRRYTRFEIERRDSCDITVEFTFDADDVEYERMEIEVQLDADRDGNSRNDTKTVRFDID